MISPSWKIIAGAAFFALIPVGVKMAPESGVITLMSGRLLVAVLILYLLSKRKKELLFQLKERWIGLFFWSMIMLGAMWTYFKSIQWCGAAISGSLLGTQPVFMALLSVFILKEKLSFSTIGIAVVCLTGVFMVSNPNSSNETDIIFGIFAGTISSLLLCFNFLLQKKWFSDIQAKDIVFYQSIMQIPILVPLALMTEEMHFSVIPASLILGIFCTVFAYVLIYDGALHVKGQMIGILQSIEYALPIPFGILFFGEHFDLLQLIGTSLILGSCILVPFLEHLSNNRSSGT